LKKEIEEKLKADKGLATGKRKPKTLVGQHYPHPGLHDAPSGAGIQKLEVKNI